MENSTRHGIHRRASSALILIAIFLMVVALGVVRGDNVLVANGPGQNLISIDKIYSTSTIQPAMLAINGGTISSINDLIAILPPPRLNRAAGGGDPKPDHSREPENNSIRCGADRKSGCEKH